MSKLNNRAESVVTNDREKVLLELEEQFNLVRTGQGLAVKSREGNVTLIGKFRVHGVAYSTTGSVLGIAIARLESSKKKGICIVPLDALRFPRKIPEYFEKIGLLAPYKQEYLQLIAEYLKKISAGREKTVVTSEGVHHIADEELLRPIAVIGDTVIGGNSEKFLPIQDRTTSFAVKGTLKKWNNEFKPLLANNPLMIVTLCFGLAVPLAGIANLRLIGLLIAGPSSTGKTTLGRFLMSLYRAPGDPPQWAGTANGIEALALQHRDLPFVLDELGSSDAKGILQVIYRISGGVSKARSTVTGALQQTEVIRSPIFATGEVTLRQQSNVNHANMKAGHDARMPTILVDEKYGIYSNIGEVGNGAEFSALVSEAMNANYGVVYPAYLEAVVPCFLETQKFLADMQTFVRDAVAGENITHMTGVERRVLDGFVNMALAGELAISHGLVPMKAGDAMNAVAYVYKQWLHRWRQQAHEPLTAPLHGLRNYFQRYSPSKFVELDSNWHDNQKMVLAGYRKFHKKHGLVYLVFPNFFENELCKEHGVDATFKALRHADLIVLPNKGRKMMVRMPGRPNDESGSRIAFYAISERILFDE